MSTPIYALPGIHAGSRVIPNYNMAVAVASQFNAAQRAGVPHTVVAVTKHAGRKMATFDCHPDKHPRAVWLAHLKKIA